MRADMPFVKSLTKESKDKNGQAVGTRKPGESQKGRAPWATKAAKDREKQLYDPARQIHIQGRPETRLGLCGEGVRMFGSRL